MLALSGVGRRLDLDVAPQGRRRQALAHLLGVLDQGDLVVVGGRRRPRQREGRRVGHGDRDVLPQVVRAGAAQAGQRVDELLDAACRLGAV